MRTRRLQRGATMLEAMIAMGVLMIGAVGLAGLHRESMFFMAESRQATRAGAFAQDLAAQIELWDYTDPRLANTSTANDADPTAGFDTMDTPPADHGEGEILPTAPVTWTGLANDLLLANRMERYWNVSYGDDSNGNGVPDDVRVTIIVRWRPGGANVWRLAVFYVVKPNPGDYL